MKNRTILLYMMFVFLSNFSTILYFLTVYLEFVGLSMVAISSMMIAYQMSKFILEVPTGYIADRFGRKTSGLVGVVGMLGYYAALLLVRSPSAFNRCVRSQRFCRCMSERIHRSDLHRQRLSGPARKT